MDEEREGIRVSEESRPIKAGTYHRYTITGNQFSVLVVNNAGIQAKYHEEIEHSLQKQSDLFLR